MMIDAAIVYGEEMASFVLHDGETKDALFVKMKNDTIYVKLPKGDGKTEPRAFHKSFFQSVWYYDGRQLDLSKSNVPPDLNHRTAAPNSNEMEAFTSAPTSEFKVEQEYIAVNPLESSGLPAQEAQALTDVLRTGLVRTGRFQVMERSQMNEVLREQGFQQSGACSDASCIVEMGQLLGVKALVVGNIGKVGSTFSINVRIVDVATGKILKEVSELHRGSKDNLIGKVMPAVTAELAGTYEKKNPTRIILLSLGGVAVAAGATAAVFILNKEDDAAAGSLPDPNVEILFP